MGKEVISNKQAVYIVTLFLIGSAILILPGIKAGKDAWLAVLIAAIAIYPFSLIYSRIISLFPEKNFYEILNLLYGKWIGSFIMLLYSWFSFHLAVLVIRNFGEFITQMGLKKTPMWVTMLMLGLLCCWGIKLGIENIGRVAQMFFYFFFLSIIISLVLVSPQANINNLRPVFYNSLLKIAEGVFVAGNFPFGEIVVFMLIFSCLKKAGESYGVFLKGLIIGGVSYMIVSFFIILVLGEKTASDSSFPSITMIQRIDSSIFLQRLELFMVIPYMIAGFMKISVCLLGASKGISLVLNMNDYRYIALPVSVLAINLSVFIYGEMSEMIFWAGEIWPIYATPFQFIIPIIIWLSAEIHNRKSMGVDVKHG